MDWFENIPQHYKLFHCVSEFEFSSNNSYQSNNNYTMPKFVPQAIPNLGNVYAVQVK